MKNAIYLNDSYLKEFTTKVTDVKDNKYVVLDETAFYPNGGGQPFDTGVISSNGKDYPVVFVGKFSGNISHEVSIPGLNVDDIVHCKIDWERRYKLMRMHTAAHIIDAVLFQKTNALCTGNQLGTDKSRIDFSVESIDKEKMNQFIAIANEIAKQSIELKIYYLNRAEALKIPGIVKLAGAMPPDIEILRIVEIPGVDIQADGGTQVKNTSEIGEIKFLSLENRGKNNKRVYYTLD